MMKNENMKFFYSFLLIICVYMDFVQGTSRKSRGNQGGCLSYGHSCWGGHGKRGGPPRVLRPPPLSKVENQERWDFIKTLPERFQQNGAYSLYPDLNRKNFKDADSEEKFISNTLHLPSDNFPFRQSLSNNNEMDSYSKEAEAKTHQRNNSNKFGLIKQNHQSFTNNKNNNNQGLDSYEDLSSSISILTNGGVLESDLQNIPFDDLLEMKNMKILKMLTKPYETKLSP